MAFPLFSLASALGVLLLAAPAWGWADYCEDRVQATMAEMLDQRASPAGRAEKDGIQQALMSLCADAMQAAAGQTPVAAGTDLPEDDAVAEEAEETENPTFFGIEFKKADKDSAGNERLKRKL